MTFPTTRVMLRSLAIALPLALTLAANAQGTFSAGLSGTVVPTAAGAPSSFQIGRNAYDSTGTTLVAGSNAAGFTAGPDGTFSSYTYTGNAPSLTNNDLNKYAFSLYATLTGATATTATYSGTYRIFAPGYGYSANDGSIIGAGTFNATANFFDPFDANVTGLFVATSGPLQPAGFPGPVDFSVASPAEFVGLFHSNADGTAQSLTGTLSTVPEPGSIAMLMGLGVSGIALLRRRRK